MKIINEKGKLFGLINIIDLAFLIIILLLAGAIGYKTLGSKIRPQNVVVKDVSFVVKLSLKPQSYVNSLKVGDKILSGTHQTDAYIEEVTVKPGEMTTTTDSGEIKYATHPSLYDIYVKIKMKASANATVLKLGVQEIRVGGKYQVKTKMADIEGTVDSIQF